MQAQSDVVLSGSDSLKRKFRGVPRLRFANCACVLSFILTSGSKSFSRYSARFRASFGSVFFTEWLITLNWFGSTVTTRATESATASYSTWIMRENPVRRPVKR